MHKPTSFRTSTATYLVCTLQAIAAGGVGVTPAQAGAKVQALTVGAGAERRGLGGQALVEEKPRSEAEPFVVVKIGFMDRDNVVISCPPVSGQFKSFVEIQNDSSVFEVLDRIDLCADSFAGEARCCMISSTSFAARESRQFTCDHSVTAGEECGPLWTVSAAIRDEGGFDFEADSCAIPLPEGIPCGDQGADGCDSPDSCNGNGICEDRVALAGVVCREATVECDEVERCSGFSKTCPADVLKPLGAPCGDSSDDGCDAADACNAVGACIDRIDSAGTLCKAAEDECDLSEACNGVSKSCPPDFKKPDGTSCGSGSNTVCDAPDSCFDGICQENFILAGESCPGDGNECTVDACDGNGSCAHAIAEDGLACGSSSDGICDEPDSCLNGICRPNMEPLGAACPSDGIDCTQDICDGAGSCTHPQKPDGGSCGDGSSGACDTPDTCLDGVCMPNFDPADRPCLDDGNDCTDDLCDGIGSCLHVSRQDGSACGSISDTDCDDSDTCLEGICRRNFSLADTVCPDDGNECTDDICNGMGACIHPSLPGCCESECCGNADCDDGQFCNGSELCLAGECASGNPPCGGVCCESTDACTGCPCGSDDDCGAGECCSDQGLCAGCECQDDDDCDDDAFCNGEETCDTLLGQCQPGIPPCQSGDACDDDDDECLDTCVTDQDCQAGESCDSISGECFDDDDSDGVSNEADQCPNSPPQEPANENGCTLSQLGPPAPDPIARTDNMCGCGGTDEISAMMIFFGLAVLRGHSLRRFD